MKPKPFSPASIRMLLGTLFLLAASHLSAKISFQLDKKEAYEHKTIRGVVNVENEEGNFSVSLPEIEGLTFKNLGTLNNFTSTSIINGKVTTLQRLTLEFSIRAAKPGTYEIDGVEILDGKGGAIPVEKFPVVFLPIVPNDNLRLRIEPTRPSFYPGETLEFKIIFAYNGSIQDYRIDFDLFDDPNAESLGMTQSRYAGGRPRREFTVGNYQVPFLPEFNDQTANHFEAFLEFYPKNGIPEINPAFAEAILRLRKNGSVVRERIVVKSNLPKFNVLPFPEEGKPEFFEGASGLSYTLTSSVDGSPFRTGDPIPVRVDIGGSRPPRGEFKAHFDPEAVRAAGLVLGEIEDYTVEDKTIRYTQIFYPEKAGTAVIPPARFAYFIPETQRYDVTETFPKTLEITQSEFFDESSIFIGATADSRRAKPTPVSVSELRADNGSTLEIPFLASLVLPPSFSAMFLAGLWAKRRYFGNEAVRMRRYESERSIRIARLKNPKAGGDFAAELSEHFSWMLKNRYGLKNGYLGNPEDLKGLGENKKQALKELQNFLDASRYSAKDSPPDPAKIAEKFRLASETD